MLINALMCLCLSSPSFYHGKVKKRDKFQAEILLDYSFFYKLVVFELSQIVILRIVLFQ